MTPCPKITKITVVCETPRSNFGRKLITSDLRSFDDAQVRDILKATFGGDIVPPNLIGAKSQVTQLDAYKRSGEEQWVICIPDKLKTKSDDRARCAGALRDFMMRWDEKQLYLELNGHELLAEHPHLVALEQAVGEILVRNKSHPMAGRSAAISLTEGLKPSTRFPLKWSLLAGFALVCLLVFAIPPRKDGSGNGGVNISSMNRAPVAIDGFWQKVMTLGGLSQNAGVDQVNQWIMDFYHRVYGLETKEPGIAAGKLFDDKQLFSCLQAQMERPTASKFLDSMGANSLMPLSDILKTNPKLPTSRLANMLWKARLAHGQRLTGKTGPYSEYQSFNLIVPKDLEAWPQFWADYGRALSALREWVPGLPATKLVHTIQSVKNQRADLQLLSEAAVIFTIAGGIE